MGLGKWSGKVRAQWHNAPEAQKLLCCLGGKSKLAVLLTNVIFLNWLGLTSAQIFVQYDHCAPPWNAGCCSRSRALHSLHLSVLTQEQSKYACFVSRLEARNETGQRVHCFVAALPTRSSVLEKNKSFRPTHWIKEHGERHYPSRNGLRRQNLTRDCHSRHIKHNGLFVHQPCQRQFNYWWLSWF